MFIHAVQQELHQILEKVQHAAVPEASLRISEDLGFSSSNDRSILKILSISECLMRLAVLRVAIVISSITRKLSTSCERFGGV